MGIFYDYNKNYKNNNNNSEKSETLECYPNPNFKNKITIATNYLHSIDIFFQIYHKSCYEIYTLKNKNEGFYIAFQEKSKIVKILNYNIKKKSIIKITTIPTSVKIIKYFNDEINNKEYLFLIDFKIIKIYLIRNENNYDNVYNYEEKGILGSGFSGCYLGSLPIHHFEIFNNIYNNENYVIISFFYRTDCSGYDRKISTSKFKKNKLFKINHFVSGDSSLNNKKLFLIWKNKNTHI